VVLRQGQSHGGNVQALAACGGFPCVSDAEPGEVPDISAYNANSRTSIVITTASTVAKMDRRCQR
jgi:hypothetical protein